MRLEAGRRIRAQAPFLLVLAVMLLAVAYLAVEPGHWRRGVGIIAASMLLAAIFRFTLRRAHIGLLAVRSRWMDTACYLLLSVSIIVVAIRLNR
jgi:GNAT superfamily N-acetyltransferase